MTTPNESSKKYKKSDTTIVIVSKSGTLSEAVVKPENETTLEELTILLSKKCGYRNHDGFSCYHTYKYKNKKKFSFNMDNEDVIPKYIYVDVWAKTDGRAGNENKYEMPPPVDEIIYYGNIALVARMDNEHAVNLTTTIWNVIYERLFGGFEDLAATCAEDEEEEDELENIPASKKTKQGYLKDGFVVDSDSSDDKDDYCSEDDSDDDDEDDEAEEQDGPEDVLELEDIGSELSEEEYESSSDDDA